MVLERLWNLADARERWCKTRDTFLQTLPDVLTLQVWLLYILPFLMGGQDQKEFSWQLAPTRN